MDDAYDTGWARGYEHGKKAKTPCTAQLPPDATEYDEWLLEGYCDGYNYAQQETQQCTRLVK